MKNKTILYVDDYKPLLVLYTRLLEAAGYRVITASDGQEGIRSFTNSHPDIVLLDYNMGGLNGREVAVKLRKIDAAVPLIMFSGEEIPPEAYSAVDASIRKNEGFLTLIGAVSGLLEGSFQTKAS